jgi:hypothetical protein
MRDARATGPRNEIDISTRRKRQNGFSYIKKMPAPAREGAALAVTPASAGCQLNANVVMRRHLAKVAHVV